MFELIQAYLVGWSRKRRGQETIIKKYIEKSWSLQTWRGKVMMNFALREWSPFYKVLLTIADLLRTAHKGTWRQITKPVILRVAQKVLTPDSGLESVDRLLEAPNNQSAL